MKIARYIGDLLYDYECVVVPGFGGFLVSENSATINTVTHHFKPPFKKIFFNEQLRANDGLLVNYVAKEQGLTYKEAKSQVDKFVFLCHNALKNGKRINFHRIGYIYYDEKENIVFEQDTSINYDANSFGLIAFISPAVRRLTNEERLKEKIGTQTIYKKRETISSNKPADRKNATTSPREKSNQTVKKNDTHRYTHHMQAQTRKSPFKTQLTFLTIILLAIFIGVAIMHKEKVKTYYNKYASSIPFFYRSPNSYFIDNINKDFVQFSNSKTGIQLSSWIENIGKKDTNNQEIVKKRVIAPSDAYNNLTPATTEKKDTLSEPGKNNMGAIQQASLLENIIPEQNNEPQPITDNSKQKTKPVTSLTKPDISTNSQTLNISNNSGHIFIIAGSFKSMYNAKKLVRMLINKGYYALIADTNRYGMYRVAYGRFSDMMEAENKMAIIRSKDNPAAWILNK